MQEKTSMNATVADRLVAEYLARLNAALRDLPAARREELLDQVSEHIATARAELGDQAGEAEIRTMLDRLGDPAAIAAEASQRPADSPEPSQPHAGWREIGALILLPVGGIVIPVVGWFVGLALLWSSDLWSTRSKLIGTLVVPGGLALPLSLGLLTGSTEYCSTPPTQVGGGGAASVCAGGPPAWWEVLGPVVFVLLLLAPLATVIYLGRQLRRRPDPAPAMS
jgi:HAAS domain-containing protein